jgi:outer membrane immunogenic protein
LALLTLALPAVAADIGGGTAPSTVTGYSWAGTFFGLNAGYEWGRTSGIGARPAGGAGGAQVGYNWQTGAFVFGGETDLQFSGAGDTFGPWQFSNPWFGSVRGRAGFAMNNVMFYATAGLSYGGLRAQLAAASETKNLGGWAAGAGVEVGLSGNWSARAEYLFMDLSDRGYVLTGTNVGFESGLMRFGVNYRF